MAEKFVLRGSSQRRANVKSAVQREVDPQAVADALGARPGNIRSGAVLDLFEVRTALKSMVRSSGGRPGIGTATDRVKIPKIEEDWVKLEELAKKLRGPGQVGQKLSLAQVAAVVLHLALEKLPERDIEEALCPKRVAR
jgi:hypothetical protein